MSATPSIPLEINRGDNETLDVAFKTPDGLSPLDITGAEGAWWTAKYRTSDADADAVAQKVLGDGLEIVDASAGTAKVRISAADFVGVPSCILVWDAQIKDSNGEIRTAARGYLKVNADVTRDEGGS